MLTMQEKQKERNKVNAIAMLPSPLRQNENACIVFVSKFVRFPFLKSRNPSPVPERIAGSCERHLVGFLPC